MAGKSQKQTKAGVSHRPGTLPAAEFKAICLELMDRVRETGVEYVVTKHGRPVAKLVPYVESAPKKFVGTLKGTVVRYVRPFDPIDAEWDVDKPSDED